MAFIAIGPGVRTKGARRTAIVGILLLGLVIPRVTAVHGIIDGSVIAVGGGHEVAADRVPAKHAIERRCMSAVAGKAHDAVGD